MKKLLVIFLLAAPALAQTISPVINECGKKCSGAFTFRNNGLEPMMVTVEPASFSIDAATGHSIYRPLDSTVEVLMNEMSARVGPREEHQFDYSIQCSVYPCMVVLRTIASGGHTDAGVQLRFQLPEVIYQCNKAKNCRANTRKALGLKG